MKKGKGESLPGIFLLDVLNSTAAFYTSHSEPGGIREAADDTRLPFQRALHGFVEFHRVVEVDDVDVAVRCTDH